MTKKTKFELPSQSDLIGPTGPPGDPGPAGATGGPGPSPSFFIAASSDFIAQTQGNSQFLLIGNTISSSFDAGILFSENATINNLTVQASDFPVGQVLIQVEINGIGTSLLIILNPSTQSGTFSIPGGVLVNAVQYISFEVTIESGSGDDIAFLASVEVTPISV